jgi:hypothetical protein
VRKEVGLGKGLQRIHFGEPLDARAYFRCRCNGNSPVVAPTKEGDKILNRQIASAGYEENFIHWRFLNS